MKVREQLYEQSPFDGIDLDGVMPDIQGWGSDHPVIKECIQELRPTLIAEVGVWKGRCAINMHRYCNEVDCSAEILAIDTWLGSPEHWLRRGNPNFYDSLRLKNGYPQIFWTFMRNVIDAGAQESITPMPMSSEVAFYVLSQFQVSLDLVHIDAGHEFESVTADLIRYWSLIRPGGILIGDDYVNGWPGVKRAADEFARSVGRRLRVEERKYVLRK